MSKRRFIYGQATDKGNFRDINQDAALSIVLSGAGGMNGEDVGLFMIADGMGGKGMAEEAARLSVQIVAQTIIEQLRSAFSTPIDDQQPPFSDILVSAFQKANAVIEAHNSKEWVGGATATAVLIVGEKTYIAYVGDVKGYIVSQVDIEQVTISHDFASELLRRGAITLEQYNMSGHKIYRAFGFEGTIEVDTTTHELKHDDSLVICCDGIWVRVEDERIREIVSRYSDPQEASEQLIASVNANQPTDNMTAIVVKMTH